MLFSSVSVLGCFLTVSDKHATQMNLTYVFYIREVQRCVGLRAKVVKSGCCFFTFWICLLRKLPLSQAGSPGGGRAGCWCTWAAILLVVKWAVLGERLLSDDPSQVPVGVGAAFPGLGGYLSLKQSLWPGACVSQMDQAWVVSHPLLQGKRSASNSSVGKSSL